jgi:hypothetical protein
MNKREKIIIIGMVLAILYGAYSLLFDSRPDLMEGQTGTEIAPIEQFVIGVTSQLRKADDSARDAFLVNAAKDEWKRDPMVQVARLNAAEAAVVEDAAAETAAPVEVNADGWTYTGFLEMGKRRLAILNGQEYEPGDMLSPDGYYLKGVTARHVVIGRKGAKETVTINLEETN